MPSCLPAFAELCATSNFTFLTGASHPEELVEQAATLGCRAIAVTDRNTVAGIVRGHVAAQELGFQYIVGTRLRFDEPVGLDVVVYPTDRVSYGRMCRLLTIGKRRAEKGQCHLHLHDLLEHQEGLLAVVIPSGTLDQSFLDTLDGLRRRFDDDRLSLAAGCTYRGDDRERLEQLADLSAHARVPLVATNQAQYHVPRRRAVHDVVACLRAGCMLGTAGYRLNPHAEHHLKGPAEMARLMAAYPGSLERSVEIAERAAAFDLDQLRYEYPHEVCPPGQTPIRHLAELTRAGTVERYPDGVPGKVRRKIEYELRLIDELDYAPYFLTVHDLVVFARSRGILCQGRGAAANSAVCYCLGVTAVDPDRIDLLFERFVSKERNEPPDIDIDFEHERREEVIQYIYGKYGRDRAALTAEVISYRGRSAVREVGKVLGLSLDCVDRLARNMDWWHDNVIDPRRFRDLGLDADDPTICRLVHLVRDILGFPRHLSQHVGGFVITRGPLCEIVPVENAAMPDRTVIEWDKDDIDAMGMLKVDVLGLGMLTCIRKAFEFVNRVRERRRDEETKRRSEEGEGRGVREDVPGSGRVAEGDGVGASHLSGDQEHAERGAVRSDAPDAASGRVSAIEHCGRIREGDDRRPDSVLANRKGIVERAGHAVRACSRDESAERRLASEGSDPGDGSCSPSSDQQPRGEALNATTSSLRLSVSSSLSSPLALHTVPPEDPAVYDMICHADTVGVFQIESRAQMSMLPRLRPRCYYDLVIEVAIVRPGPIQGDMVHPYLRRRNGEEPVSYPSPDVRKVLAKTLGVPLFQEQAMALAIVAAGFTPGEADQLRRAMAAWKRKGNQIEQFGRRLIAGMRQRGYERDFAERCFEQIKGFSEYGFPESHAASFALLVYVSSWLKRHEPAAFAAALINSQPMGFYAPAQIVRDAQDHGVEVRPVDVTHSRWDCTLEERHEGTEARRHEGGGQPAIRLGMRLIKGLREEHADAVVAAVRDRGPFATVEGLWRTSGVPVAAMRKLAGADAFGSMGLDRQGALWQVRALRDDPLPMFDGLPTETGPAADEKPPLPEVPPVRRVMHDYASVRLSLKAHPMSFVREELDRRGVIRAVELQDETRHPNGRRVSVAGIALVRQRPSTAHGIVFMTLEDETGIANLVLRPKVFERFRAAARHGVTILATGQVERQGGVVHVMVGRLEALDERFRRLQAPVEARSRDFH